MAPDGGIYITDTWNNRVRWIGPDSITRTVLGTGSAGYSGDGGLATQALLGGGAMGSAVGPDGAF